MALGPTWQRVTGWKQDMPLEEQYVLPELTLGWALIRWVERYLLADDGGPFMLTFEQRRLLLWWYAVDERGRFVYRDGVLQRLKGWGRPR